MGQQRMLLRQPTTLDCPNDNELACLVALFSFGAFLAFLAVFVMIVLPHGAVLVSLHLHGERMRVSQEGAWWQRPFGWFIIAFLVPVAYLSYRLGRARERNARQ